MADDVLLRAQSGRVLTLTLHRPQALNALTPELLHALRRAVEAAGRDDGVGCVVITGSGRAFSAGGDVAGMQSSATTDRELGDDLRANYAPLIRAIRACPRPVIAAINGTAAGAGLSIALACDIRMAVGAAQLIVVFVRVGLVPDAGSLFFLSRLLGYGKALELALTGEPLSAQEALRLGLVSEVVDGDALMGAAQRRAERLAAGPTTAHALIKRGMERALSLDLEQTMELEAQLQTLAGKTRDHQEAVKAFLAKRNRTL